MVEPVWLLHPGMVYSFISPLGASSSGQGVFIYQSLRFGEQKPLLPSASHLISIASHQYSAVCRPALDTDVMGRLGELDMFGENP